MTRTRRASDRFLAGLPCTVLSRFAPVFSPLIDIVPIDALINMSGGDAAIFTSLNGVNAGPDGKGRTAYCVGPATTQAAITKGWAAEHAGADAHTLVETLAAIKPTQPLFHLSGRHTRGNIVGRLRDIGLNIRNIALYEQKLCPLSAEAARLIRQEDHVIVPLFSPRTAAQFAAVAPRTSSVHVLAMSRAVSDALGPLPLLSLNIADHPDAQSMSAALAKLV